jgi:peptidoglycan hydrolase-like protein with peptidoglycan-binding domain
MKKIIFIAFVILSLGLPVCAQTTGATVKPDAATNAEKPKKQIFRANQEQVAQVQKMLKDKGLYAGEASGKMDDALRTAIKSFQNDNALKQTGTLNRATLEKMGVALTDKQKEMPVNPNSFATGDSSQSPKTKRPPVFRASKDQIMLAQKLLKDKGIYDGDQTGKLDDQTRDGLKKYQEASGLKITGTLNQITLEKMGIELTDKQKENAAKQKENAAKIVQR